MLTSNKFKYFSAKGVTFMQFKKFFSNRGQAMVLYVLLIPILFLLVGVGIDLGWYFINVSRLQNAADAAALAGASELVEDGKTMESYYVDGLTYLPKDIADENKYKKFNVEGENGKISKEEVEIKQGKAEAQLYAVKNLNPADVTVEKAVNASKKTVTNGWTSSMEKKDNVNFGATLYTRLVDKDREELAGMASTGYRYYQVELTEKVNHLFLRGYSPMQAKVVACAVLKPRDNDLFRALDNLEKEKVIANVLREEKLRYYKGNWAHYQDQAIYYTKGDNNREEVVNVGFEFRNDKITDAKGSNSSDRIADKYTFSYNKGDPSDVDSLNLDFRLEYNFSSKFYGKDWDLRSELPTGVELRDSTDLSLAKGWRVGDEAALYRVVTSFNFSYAWDNRHLTDSDSSNDLTPDVLWTHIESEPLWFEYGSSWNSVHQIVFNAQVSNADTAPDSTKEINGVKVYKKRPFFIFYTGPEVYDMNSTVRQSQPVILNLYCDWNACLFLPNSPVIINGNGHKLTGFVVAKEFRRLATLDDYSDTDKYFVGTDTINKTIIIPTANQLTESDINPEGNYTLLTNDAGGTHVFKENFKPRLIIESEYVKGLAGYTYENYKETLKHFRRLTDDSQIAIVTMPEFTADGAKNNQQKYPVVASDLKIDKPEDFDDKATPTTEKYVVVLLDGDETKKRYIDKSNLPYVKIYRSSDGDKYPYVPVSDLKAKNDPENHYAGVRLANNDTNALLENKDSWYVYRDAMNNLYHKTYGDGQVLKFEDNDGYKCFMTQSDFKNNEYLLGEYRKVTNTNGDVRYVKETYKSNEYYVQSVPDGAEGKDVAGNEITNPIITDNLGDLQSVPITPPQFLDDSYKNVAGNLALNAQALVPDSTLNKYFNYYTREPNGTNGAPNKDTKPAELPGDCPEYVEGATGTADGKYRGSDNAHKNEDYRIPYLERVYKAKEAFNLSEESRYSYFGVQELKRVNYNYLNVDELNKLPTQTKDGEEIKLWDIKDMFFTNTRAKWID